LGMVMYIFFTLGVLNTRNWAVGVLNTRDWAVCV
jgi:hypothetical protein